MDQAVKYFREDSLVDCYKAYTPSMVNNPDNVPLITGAQPIDVYLANLLIYPGRPLTFNLNKDMNVMQVQLEYQIELVWDDWMFHDENVTCPVRSPSRRLQAAHSASSASKSASRAALCMCTEFALNMQQLKFPQMLLWGSMDVQLEDVEFSLIDG